MTFIIKLAVIGLQGFDPEGIGKVFVADKFAILCCEKRIVFSDPAIIADFMPVYSNVAEQDTYLISCLGNFFSPGFAIP